MIVDLERLGAEPFSPQPTDVCVVGAGAAGIALAVELTRLGMSVALLESGALSFESRTQDLYASEVVGAPHAGVHEGRFRVLGGTTTRWGGQILELDALDFERRPWVPHSGWPIAHEEVARFYPRALELEDVAHSIPTDAAVWRRLSVAAPQAGPGLDPFFTRFCPQPDFAKLHRATLESPHGPTVYLHANACEFRVTEREAAVTAVLCRTLGGLSFTFAARSFIICLGAIETARVLLQPAQARLRDASPGSDLIGRYFQDHLDLNTATLTPLRPEQFHDWFDNIYLGRYRYIPKIRLSAEKQREMGVLAIGASFHALSAREGSVARFRETLLRLKRGEQRGLRGSDRSLLLEASDILLRKGWRYLTKHRAYNPSELGVGLRVHCEQTPDPESRVTLSRERDALGQFKSRLNWRFGAAELDTVRKFTAYAARCFERADIAKADVHYHLLDGEAFTAHVSDTFHHMGTARMAASANHGVVDTDLRLFGIDNAYLCGSAVFPTSGFSNPTHTILALAVRLAAHLSARRDRAATMPASQTALVYKPL